MWPEFVIEALEGRLNGCIGGVEQGRGALLPTLFVAPWRLGMLALPVLGVGVGYGEVLILGGAVLLAATRACE